MLFDQNQLPFLRHGREADHFLAVKQGREGEAFELLPGVWLVFVFVN